MNWVYFRQRLHSYDPSLLLFSSVLSLPCIVLSSELLLNCPTSLSYLSTSHFFFNFFSNNKFLEFFFLLLVIFPSCFASQVFSLFSVSIAVAIFSNILFLCAAWHSSCTSSLVSTSIYFIFLFFLHCSLISLFYYLIYISHSPSFRSHLFSFLLGLSREQSAYHSMSLYFISSISLTLSLPSSSLILSLSCEVLHFSFCSSHLN